MRIPVGSGREFQIVLSSCTRGLLVIRSRPSDCNAGILLYNSPSAGGLRNHNFTSAREASAARACDRFWGKLRRNAGRMDEDEVPRGMGLPYRSLWGL